jgi:L-alanine-DL-glutamate epimerase-like enolase superfamily enzyme
MNRRELLRAAGAFAVAGVTTSQILKPLKAIAADIKRVRIQNIEAFAIQLPRAAGVPSPTASATGSNANPSRLVCTRVTTDAGVRGYSFLGGSTADVENAKKVMVGEDLFAVEQHLSRGLINCAPIEESVWDAIGRTAGQPVHRLLGGARTATLPVYITYVWGDRQTKVTPEQQAEWGVVVKKAGFTAMKVQIWRPNFMEDVEACSDAADAMENTIA